MKKTICVVTSSRADYGHLKGVITEIRNDPKLKLQLVVTGSHLSARHGMTVKDIQRDGFKIHGRAQIVDGGDTEVGVIQTIGVTCQMFAHLFKKLRPDTVVLLGDRYEIFAVAVAAYVTKIPIAHLHGGETSQGVLDEAFRHSITKMGSLHFPATEEYRRRIIQLGENPKFVFNYGAPGLDGLATQKFLSRKELSSLINFDLNGPVAIVTYHPVTLEQDSPARQIKDTLAAIKASGLKAVFTEANADAYGSMINRQIKAFVRKNPKKYKFIPNLGRERYFSCLKHCDVMIGNSSSGIVEASSFGIPVVNIGDRQEGRIKAGNVIDVQCRANAIGKAIRLALSAPFKRKARAARNPYVKFRDGRAGYRIKEKIKSLKMTDDLLKKQFFNLSVR